MIGVVFTFIIFVQGNHPTPIPTLTQDGQLYLEVQGVSHALGWELEPFELTEGYRLKVLQHTLILGEGEKRVVMDEEILSLNAPILKKDDRLYGPISFFTLLLEKLHIPYHIDPTRLEVDLSKPLEPLRIEKIQAHDLGGFTKVVLTLSRSTAYQIEHHKGSLRIILDAPSVEGQFPFIFQDPLIRSADVEDNQIRFSLTSPEITYNHYVLSQPPRIVVDVVRQHAIKPASTLEPAVPHRFTVVLDPGHGGKDGGAQSDDGTLEKTLTLSYALCIKNYLSKNYGTRVLLTREDDHFVDLDTRVGMANHAQAHAFISIHANSARLPSASGTQVYVLSYDRLDRRSWEVVRDENAEAVEEILWDLAQQAYLKDSLRLAEKIVQKIDGDKAVKQGPFQVLMGAQMPAVLIELGFLTNTQNVQRLKDPLEAKKLCKNIAEGIHAFEVEEGKRWGASLP